MQQTDNLPSSSSASPNLPTSWQAELPQSLLITQQILASSLARFGQDYINLVFNRHKQPPTSIAMAAESTAPTFCNVTDYFSRDATLMWLRFHIAETFAFLGIYDTTSKMQVVETARLILDHEIFGQLNLDEFLLFLARFKRGDYGKIYQSARPNPQELLVCLKPFWNELVQHRIRVRKQEEQRRLEEERHLPPPTPEELAHIQEIRERLSRRFSTNPAKTRK